MDQDNAKYYVFNWSRHGEEGDEMVGILETFKTKDQALQYIESNVAGFKCAVILGKSLEVDRGPWKIEEIE